MTTYPDERRLPMSQDGRRDDDHRLRSMEKQLESQADWLKNISETLAKIAVQDERIKTLTLEVSRLRDEDYKKVAIEMKELASFQQSCPRTQLKYLWIAVAAPLWLLLLGAIWSIFFTSTAQAADLAWEHNPTQAEITVGYTVHFTDGAEEFNYTFPITETTVVGTDELWGPIEDRLNLIPGVEYFFNLSRYNASGTSGVEGQLPVSHTVPAFLPPTDRLPPAVSSSPSSAGNLRIE